MGSIVDLGVEHKILEKKGSWISFEGELVGQGREAAKVFLTESPEIAERISKAIIEVVQPKPAPEKELEAAKTE